MNCEQINVKKDFYLAVGYILLLIISSFPISVVGMHILNFALGEMS